MLPGPEPSPPVSQTALMLAVCALLTRFHALTGCPVLVNTSFNVRGEPIVCTPRDAHLRFMRTEMDNLVRESFILGKRRQPRLREDVG
jgi:carbamoyltransferase